MLVPPPPPPVPPPPPHAIMPPVRATRNASIPSIVRKLRRRAGMPKSRTNARVAPPVAYQGTPGPFGYARAALLAAVVEMVRVAVFAIVSVILTGLVEPKLKVGGYWAPVGLEVTVAVSATLPVKPPSGVTVMVELLPVVAPRETVTVVPPSEKLWTETGAVPLLAL